MQRRYVTLDVFTDIRFAGNPLAVVLDADHLDTASMQTIAREFNYPETVFVRPASNPAHRARLRIFTPLIEHPFAGHPTIGTAVLLGLRDSAGGRQEFVIEETAGDIACRVDVEAPDRGRARFVAPRLPVQVGEPPGRAVIAAALGLDEADIGFDGLEPARWSAGIPFVFVPVRRLEAVARSRPDPARFEPVFAGDVPGAACVFCPETVKLKHDFHVRMFAPGMGIPEDPATGSAAAALAGLLSAHLADGEHTFLIEQGVEMGRASSIEMALRRRGGRIEEVTIGGAAIVVAEGLLEA